MIRRVLRLAAFTLPLTGLAFGQMTRPSSEPAPGHRLFSPRPGKDTHLVDRNGAFVHTWTSNYVVGVSVYMKANGNLLRSIFVDSTSPIAVLNGDGGGVEELSFDGTQLWEYRYDTDTVLSHHDVQPLPNGNVLLMAWETRTASEAIAAGRDPALITGDSFPDHIVEVMPTGPTSGSIVWEWHVWDHLIQDFDPTQANYGVPADHPELIDVNFPPTVAGGELHHFNGMDYDPVHDWIIISARTQDELWIIDHSTTTAEAAGHTGGNHGKGGDLLYRWGNPQAYGRGTAADQALFGQHDPRFIPAGRPGAGHVTVFNNQAPGGSQVNELVLPLDVNGDFVLAPGARYGPAKPVWTYRAPEFDSGLMSSAERLPNGNMLICSSLQGRIFEIDELGSVLFEVAVPPQIPAATFQAHYAPRTMWASSSSLPAATGGRIEFDVVAGTEFAGDSYLLLGSSSGSSPGFDLQGFHVPLNFDVYLRYMLRVPPSTYHGNHYGRLDALGRVSSSLMLPASVTSGFAGATFDHGFILFHSLQQRMTGATNGESMQIVP